VAIEVPTGQLYIGEGVDAATHERDGTPAMLPAADLTTHGVIVGMTGSGKTGLGIAVLEEVLLSGVPTLVLDPKGDLTNLLLTFPDLAAVDFAPWVESGDPAAVATQWSDGLASWGMDGARIKALRDAASFTVYTPGSTAGVPLNVVGSLRAPKAGLDPELVRDEVEGFVAGLLGLVGIDADPLASKEFVLLANLVEKAWANGQDLDLATLVQQVQTPPLRKLGVFELDAFFPPADRTKLAMRLNGLLASSSFAAWAQGPELDIDALLWPGGKPACAIVELAHLSDEERQFAVSLVLGKVVTWMRQQPGTSNLRALVYFDEVMGFVPPTAAPPAKQPILTILKQARAFGVGIVLTTQNPVDVDYKALSNAGTWAVGRLQTEQDKGRLLDGMRAAAGGVDVGAVDATISGLAKREFVLRRAGHDTPSVITSRWDLSYLRGPLTRDQIATLMADQKAAYVTRPAAPVPAAAPAQPAPAAPELSTLPPPPSRAAVAAAAVPLGADETTVAPQVAAGIPVRFLDAAAPWHAQVGAVPGSPRLAPAIVARAELLFDDDAAGMRDQEQWEAVLFPLTENPDPASAIAVDYDDRDLLAAAPPGVRYVLGAAPLTTKGYFTKVERSLVDHLYRNRTRAVLRNKQLKAFARPGETAEQFGLRCQALADQAADAEIAKLQPKYQARMAKLQGAIADANVAKHEAEAGTGIRILSGALDVFSGRRANRGINSATTAARQAATASRKAAAKESDLAALQHQADDEIASINAEWDAVAGAIDTLTVPLEKSDIRISDLSLVWVPSAEEHDDRAS
jgi:hypothetical protein